MIWCVGKNYRRHADEVGMGIDEYPEVFAKGINSIQNPDEPIRIPARAKSSEIDYEGELVVVIGKPCKDVAREHALAHVAGYTCGNDVSADRKSTRLNSSHVAISYAVFCLKKKTQ